MLPVQGCGMCGRTKHGNTRAGVVLQAVAVAVDKGGGAPVPRMLQGMLGAGSDLRLAAH